MTLSASYNDFITGMDRKEQATLSGPTLDIGGLTEDEHLLKGTSPRGHGHTAGLRWEQEQHADGTAQSPPGPGPAGTRHTSRTFLNRAGIRLQVEAGSVL